MGRGSLGRPRTTVVLIMALIGALTLASPAGATRLKQRRLGVHAIHRASDAINRFGELDCNGDSPAQSPVRPTMACTDVRGYNDRWNANTWTGHFYDNGKYIGHDEPDMTFYSSQSGSGDNVSWTETLPTDPSAAPTVGTPGADVTHWFELSVAPWFSMAMCDPKSYPENPCSPERDSNAPTCVGAQTTDCYPGGGSAFMEMQFYPPGFSPFADSISCDNTHWCAALNIDSLECTLGFATCNGACEEPVNFAYIQTDGNPTGPPDPQDANLATFTPNAHTLLMGPGDRLSVHMFDAQVPGAKRGVRAFEVVVQDLTTGQTGYMQASADNGFQNTSMSDCSGTPFNFQPEYNTAASSNITPWAALATNISTEYEIGHFEACSSVTKSSTLPLAPGVTDTTWNDCHGPYEDAAPGGDGSKKVESTDSPCYPAGDTHGSLNTAPDTVTGCVDIFAGGDLDFDGTPYWADWPTSTAPGTFPGSFVQSLPTTSGTQYSQFMIQTDTALSESTCPGSTDSPGCAVPPPNAPGQFYPFWSRVGSNGSCAIEFGNISSGNMGGDAQYGTNQVGTLGYPEFEGPVQSNSSCT